MGISSGRIIDNAGRKALAIGTEDFGNVITNYVYVDKSLLVRELVDRPGQAVLFCRPRRFGKSLAMRMLQCYFEASVPEAGIPDRSALFDGLAIMQAGERYTREQGAHPVISLSLGEVEGNTWEEAIDVIRSLIAYEYQRHAYLLEAGWMSDAEVERFRDIVAGRARRGDLYTSLSSLSGLLARYHGTNTVILIDEYDKPITLGHLNGYRDDAINFICSWMTGALKGTTSLYLGVLTGVQRVSHSSIFSGLNNIVVDTALDHGFTEAFGFTDAEVVELASYLGLAGAVPELRDWYDGYVFGGERVYNPWSLLKSLSEGGAAQPYWTNTASNDIVHDLFRQAEGATREELEALAAGGTVSEPLDLASVFDMIGVDPQAIWSQLYLAGYLTTEDTEKPNDVYMPRELRVPNREVGLLYRHEFADRSGLLAGGSSRLAPLHKALVAGDAPALEAALRRILLDSPSALDLVRENSYHMLLVGLLYYVYGYKFPLSNREAGDGRADVLLVPERENLGRLPGLSVEVKWGRGLGDTELGALAEAALAQAESRDYVDALPAGPRLTWGVAFSGKQVAARCR